MLHRTMHRFAITWMPALVACSSSSSVGQTPDDAGGTPQEQHEAAAPPPPVDSGIAASGGDGGGVMGPSDDSGVAAAMDAVVPVPATDAGVDDSAAAADNDAEAGVAAPPPVDASAVGDGGGAPLTVYIAGDSTVSQYVLDPNNPKSWAGWGQMFAVHFNSKVTVVDAAVGGRTALRFVQEGHLAAILGTIKAGDFLLVQFGTNDGTMGPTYTINGVTYPYYAPADTTFKTNLQPYIDGAHTKGAIPVLVTPPPRNSAYCGGGQSLANYGQAMISVGMAQSVAVVDLGTRAHAYLSAICPKPTTAAQENFFKVNPDGTIDGTHFQENGARMLATFVADGITQDGLGLAAYRIK